MAIIMPIIKNSWEMSAFTVELISSLFYFGMFFGSIITGKLADNFGRRIILIISSATQFVITISFGICNNSFSFGLVRFLYGFCFGFSLPLTTSMMAEISPLKYRGKMLVIINFMVTIGKVFAIILAIIFLNADLQKGNWKLMMISSSIPIFIVFFGSIFFIKESPRFLIAEGNIEKAVEISEHIAKTNGNFLKIENEQKKEIEVWQKETFEQNEKAHFSSLINKNNIKLTLLLWGIWVIINFCYHGQLTILPFIIGYGASNAAGRLGATIMPYILFPLYRWHNLSPLLLIGFACFLGFLFSYYLPFDTKGRYLDSYFSDSKNNNKEDIYVELEEMKN